MERIGELVLEHASPAGRTRPAPLLLVHGMWGGSERDPGLGRPERRRAGLVRGAVAGEHA
jgi:hypothetical protein